MRRMAPAALATALLGLGGVATAQTRICATTPDGQYCYDREQGGGRAVYYFRYTIINDAGKPETFQPEWRYGTERGQRCNKWKEEYVDPFINEAQGDEIAPGIGMGCYQSIPAQ